jgi:type II secretory pathway pseudopilin PulG
MVDRMRSGRPQRRAGGFTYIGLLIAVAVIAAGSAAALGAGANLQRRDNEAELLAIGREFRHALQAYADATPVGQPDAPRELTELLRDPRHLGVRRHLRRIYPDPLTGKSEWGIERSPDGRIRGIHSLSRTAPFRNTGFPPGMEGFEQAERHDQWVFALTPSPRATPPRALPLAGG